MNGLKLKNLMSVLCFSVASAACCFGEKSEYFLKYVTHDLPLTFYRSASIREAYDYLLGKKITEDEWLESFVESKDECVKSGSAVSDLAAKRDLVYVLRVSDFLPERERWEMMREVLRDIYSDYGGYASCKSFDKALKLKFGNRAECLSEKSRECLRRQTFRRERSYYVFLKISSGCRKPFVEGLFRVYGNDYRKIIESYERSRIWKEDGRTLSEYMKVFLPKHEGIEAIVREEGLEA